MRFSRRCVPVRFKGGPIDASDIDVELQFDNRQRSPMAQNVVPLLAALLFHLLVLVMAIFSPIMLFRRPPAIDVYTVKMFRVSEFEPAPVQVPPSSTVTAEDKPVEQEKAAKHEVITLSPTQVKKKVVKKEDEKKQEDLFKQKLASLKAEQAAKKAKAAADAAAAEAVARLAKAYQEQYSRVNLNGTQAINGVLSDAQKSYLASLHTHILKNWVLPDLPNWEKHLEAVAVIHLNRQGKLLDYFFELKADNSYFNNFVEKAIKASDPLPAFPDALEEKEMEIGLRFKPGEIN